MKKNILKSFAVIVLVICVALLWPQKDSHGRQPSTNPAKKAVKSSSNQAAKGTLKIATPPAIDKDSIQKAIDQDIKKEREDREREREKNEKNELIIASLTKTNKELNFINKSLQRGLKAIKIELIEKADTIYLPPTIAVVHDTVFLNKIDTVEKVSRFLGKTSYKKIN